jgi:hypothetical protein
MGGYEYIRMGGGNAERVHTEGGGIAERVHTNNDTERGYEYIRSGCMGWIRSGCMEWMHGGEYEYIQKN